MELRKIEWALLVLATLVILAVLHVRGRKAHALRKSWSPLSGYLFSIVIVSSFAAYAWYEEHWYREKLALLVNIDDAVLTSSLVGFRGCGVGIFRLSPEARTKILRRGMHSTGETVRNSSSTTVGVGGWEETPFVTAGDGTSMEYRWVGGFNCANISVKLEKAIYSALSEPSSYTTTMGDAGVIVMPEKGLVAYSFMN